MDIPLYNDFQMEQQKRIEQKMEQKMKEEKKIQEMKMKKENEICNKLSTKIESINDDDLISKFYSRIYNNDLSKFKVEYNLGSTFPYIGSSNHEHYLNNEKIKTTVNEKCKVVEDFFKAKNYPYYLKSSNITKKTETEKNEDNTSNIWEKKDYYIFECVFQKKFFKF